MEAGRPSSSTLGHLSSLRRRRGCHEVADSARRTHQRTPMHGRAGATRRRPPAQDKGDLVKGFSSALRSYFTFICVVTTGCSSSSSARRLIPSLSRAFVRCTYFRIQCHDCRSASRAGGPGCQGRYFWFDPFACQPPLSFDARCPHDHRRLHSFYPRPRFIRQSIVLPSTAVLLGAGTLEFLSLCSSLDSI